MVYKNGCKKIINEDNTNNSGKRESKGGADFCSLYKLYKAKLGGGKKLIQHKKSHTNQEFKKESARFFNI